MLTRSSWKREVPSFKAKGKFRSLPDVITKPDHAVFVTGEGEKVYHPNWMVPPKAPGPYKGSFIGEIEGEIPYLDTTPDSRGPDTVQYYTNGVNAAQVYTMQQTP